MKIFERVYDKPKNKDGTLKGNKLLGNFKIIKGKMNDYSYIVYGKNNDNGKIYKIIGREVSGYYNNPYEAGTRNFIQKLSECEDVKVYLKFNK